MTAPDNGPGCGRYVAERDKGSFELKRTFLLRISAMVAAVFAPLAAAGQVNPEAAPSSEQTVHTKYEVYVGPAYSRLRQAEAVSYSGMVGGKATIGRDWGRYFVLMGSWDYYRIGVGHAGLPSYGNPSVYSALGGPGIHATLYGNLGGLIFGELGVEHTGGEDMIPSTSFAGGFGGGLYYNLGHNLSVQLTGDRVGASFSPPDNTPQLANSTHRTWNARGTLGVVYHF
jgi:hypothetical protein